MQIMFLQDLNCQKQHGSPLECVCTCACVRTLVNMGVHVCVAQHKIYDCSKECWKGKTKLLYRSRNIQQVSEHITFSHLHVK